MVGNGVPADKNQRSDDVAVVTRGKAALRDRMRAVRRGLGPDVRAEADARTAETVAALACWQVASVVYAYRSVGAEVDTVALIERAWREGRAVALPRCVSGTRLMTWHLVGPDDGLERSSFGVLEPAAGAAAAPDPTGVPDAIALVPGLAFDRDGWRLGYGGGFYDGFLAGFAGTSVGLARRAQLVESLAALGAAEAHDLPCDVVACERDAFGRTVPAR